MNRQIKFRGRSTHSDVWCYGSLTDYGKGEYPEICGFDIFPETEERWREEKVEPQTIGQFTGLRDKRGTEIYEGDIIRFVRGQKRDESRNCVDDAEIYEVEFDSAAFRPLCNLSKATDGIEIIGNIHETRIY